MQVSVFSAEPSPRMIAGLVERGMDHNRMRGVITAAALGLLLAGCGRQGELVPEGGAASADPRIGRYYESALDGPMTAPGDTEDTGVTGIGRHRHQRGAATEPLLPADAGEEAAEDEAETEADAPGAGGEPR